ncbi:hypothetical protein JB92DRAFT_3103323 [Gautieria morchelliformis]|nr:hypothetical protein JB92DRAFT_3103323 [Gautieria morchelliformis]
MYFIIPLILASAVLGLPHQIRNPSNSVLALDAGACPGAPPVPSGAHPSDGCDGAPLTTRSPAVSRRGQMRKRQDTSSCQVVTLAQYQTSPYGDSMKAGIEAIAMKDWGGDFNLVVNPPDFPDRPLHFCYSSGTIPATLNKPPTCQVSISQIHGDVLDGATDVSLAVAQGNAASHTVSTQKASSVTSTTSVGVTLGIPDLGGIDVSQSLTIESDLAQGDSHTTTDNKTTTITITAHASKPGPCNIDLNVTTCTGEATATVPGFYTGYVWFNYPSRRDGHFKWDLEVDSELPADQRSDNATLTDSLSASNGKASCWLRVILEAPSAKFRLTTEARQGQKRRRGKLSREGKKPGMP